MPQMRMTEKSVRALMKKKHERRREYTDQALPALGIRVSPPSRGRLTNGMSWYVRVGRGSDHRRISLGRFPAVSVGEARRAARVRVAVREGKQEELPPTEQIAAAIRSAFQGGTPPTADEIAATVLGIVPGIEGHSVPTIFELSEAYIEHKKSEGKVSWKEDRRLIQRFIVPRWGGLPANVVTSSKIRELQLEIAEEKGAPRQADYVVSVLSGMFRYGISRPKMLEKWVAVNPAAGVEKYHRKPRAEKDLSWDELRQLWHACDERGDVGSRAIQLGVLTGLRRDALLGCRWDEVEDPIESGGIVVRWLEIPADRLRKGGRPLRLPLPLLAQEVLAQLPRFGSYFFPNGQGGRLKDAKWTVLKVCELSGIPNFSIKRLRTTFSTRLAELGVPTEVREELMSHSRRGVQNRFYNKWEYAEEKIEAVMKLEAKLREIL